MPLLLSTRITHAFTDVDPIGGQVGRVFHAAHEISMLRSTCVFVLLATSGALALGTTLAQKNRFEIKGEAVSLDAEVVARRAARLDQERLARVRFFGGMQAIVMALGRGEIGLNKATAMIYDCAIEVYPAFLRHLPAGDETARRHRLGMLAVEELQELAMETPAFAPAACAAERQLRSQAFRAWCAVP